ncbi:uncharacterized protein GJ701_007714 [Geothlypis trichas]
MFRRGFKLKKYFNKKVAGSPVAFTFCGSAKACAQPQPDVLQLGPPQDIRKRGTPCVHHSHTQWGVGTATAAQVTHQVRADGDEGVLTATHSEEPQQYLFQINGNCTKSKRMQSL